MSNCISTNIRSEPDQNRASKDVTITLSKAVAKVNNRGSITAAQKGGRAPKPGAKPGAKPGPKPSMKRKRVEVEDRSGEGEEPSPHRLRSRQY